LKRSKPYVFYILNIIYIKNIFSTSCQLSLFSHLSENGWAVKLVCFLLSSAMPFSTGCTVLKTEQIIAHIRFKGGATQTITVPLPPPFAQSRLTQPETLAAMDRLLEEHTDAEVAAQLNEQGYRTFDGLLFQGTHVYQLRRHHGLADRYARLRARGMLTAGELASSYGVTAQTIWRWYRQGRIAGARYNDRGSCLFLPKASQPLLTDSK
jgi:hypothetical protein